MKLELTFEERYAFYKYAYQYIIKDKIHKDTYICCLIPDYTTENNIKLKKFIPNKLLLPELYEKRTTGVNTIWFYNNNEREKTLFKIINEMQKQMNNNDELLNEIHRSKIFIYFFGILLVMS
jgi:hypothetical protein